MDIENSILESRGSYRGDFSQCALSIILSTKSINRTQKEKKKLRVHLIFFNPSTAILLATSSPNLLLLDPFACLESHLNSHSVPWKDVKHFSKDFALPLICVPLALFICSPS